jgi:hypothetical protein
VSIPMDLRTSEMVCKGGEQAIMTVRSVVPPDGKKVTITGKSIESPQNSRLSLFMSPNG